MHCLLKQYHPYVVERHGKVPVTIINNCQFLNVCRFFQSIISVQLRLINELTGRNLEVQERYLLLSINHDLIVRSILFTFIQSYINIVSNNPDISVI